MSRNAEVTLDFAGGTYLFRLPIERLAELQEATGAGPWYIQWALEASALARTVGMAPPKDMVPSYVIEPIRLGLIGGGMEAVKALKLVRDYVGPGQLAENVALAYAILGAAIQGVPEDKPVKKARAARTTAKPSRADGSDSRTSTAPALPAD